MTLVLLHGFGMKRSAWNGFLAALPESVERDVLVPGLAGHEHWPVDEFSFASEVDRLASLAPERSLWVGYSLGGRLALGVAERHPDKVQRLILISAHAGMSSPQERAKRKELDAERASRLLTLGMDAFFREWDAGDLFAGRGVVDRDGLTAEGLAMAMNALSLSQQPDLRRALAKHCSRYLVGAEDAKFRLLAESYSSLVPVSIIAGLGHDLLHSAPESLVPFLGGWC